MSKSSSGAWLDAGKVGKACEAVLVEIKKDREQKLEEAIAQEQKPWIVKGFTLRGERTREDALYILEESFYQLTALKALYWRQEAVANNLLTLSQAAPKGDPRIFVSASDFSGISDFY